MAAPIKISASRVKTLTECSYLFYLQEIQRIPQRKWPATAKGSCIHNIFEMIMNKSKVRRQEWLKNIIINGFNIEDYPSIKRYIKFYDKNIEIISPYTIEEMADLLRVAFLGIRKYFLDKTGQVFILPKYTNEERFQLDLGNGLTISGFIDLKIELSDDEFIIIDLKSQKNKFKKDEMPDNIQGLIYQLAIWEKYKAKSNVEFILLRHAPTQKTPNKHIQITPQVCEAQLNGLKAYLTYLYRKVNQFGLEEAISHPHHDKYFCMNVCSYFKEFKYQSVRKKADNALVRNYSLDSKPEICDDEFVEIRVSKACPVAKRD